MGRTVNPLGDTENTSLTADGTRQGLHLESGGDGAVLADRLVRLTPEQFEALAPRLAKLSRADAERLLALMGV